MRFPAMKAIAFALVFAFIAYAAPASAQATRTWVSGVGDDVNPCSRTAPCRTFAGAISKTAAGGEINCLDPGAWGAVTITKAITIDCLQFPGGILVSSTNAITVNAGVNDDIVIRGLELTGAASGAPGLNGVNLLSARSLTLENVIIRNQQFSNGSGIRVVPSSAAQLFLTNVTIHTSGGGTGAGIFLQPTGSGSAQVVATDVRIFAGPTAAVRADVSGLTGGNGVTMTLTRVNMAGNALGVFLFAPVGSTTPVRATIVDSAIANNVNSGVIANGPTAIAFVSNTTITNNGQGVVTGNGGVVASFQDNRLFGNGANNTFATNVNRN